MSFIIKAIAPTIYQHQSLSSFGMPIKANGNGSYSAQQEFNTFEEAKEYLRKRASIYNEIDPEGSEFRLNAMNNDIERGVLTLDAVTAYINEQ